MTVKRVVWTHLKSLNITVNIFSSTIAQAVKGTVKFVQRTCFEVGGCRGALEGVSLRC